MSVYPRAVEKRRNSEEDELTHEEMLDDMRRSSSSPKSQLEQEKRLRREIANSNERRRMQSINAGFESLKTLLPQNEGEKLSKAAILQQTSDYINQLEHEKTRLLSQNSQLKQRLRDNNRLDSDVSSQESPPPKRKKRDTVFSSTESSDEGISMVHGSHSDGDEAGFEEIKREMVDLRCQLDRERRLRMMLEEQTRNLESELYPERLRRIASQVQAQMKFQEDKERYEELRHYQDDDRPHLGVPARPASQPPVSSHVPLPMAPPSPTRHTAPFLNNNLSQKNLETIVEAILYVEGERVLKTEPKDSRVPTSDDSDKESVYSGQEDMDEDDCRSENSTLSGHESPTSLPLMCRMDTSSQTTLSATVHMAQADRARHASPHLPLGPTGSCSATEKSAFPSPIHMLHHQGTAVGSNFPHLVSRPGVIVQKS